MPPSKLDNRLAKASIKPASPFFVSPLLSRRLKSDITADKNHRKGIWKLFFLKLSAVLMAATIIFSPDPAHAKRGDRFFTPEMETSVATLVEEADSVSFWYPEMDSEDENEAKDASKEQSSTHQSASTRAALNQNRGGAYDIYALDQKGTFVDEVKLNLVPIPFLVVNSLLVVAAAVLGRRETAESLRKRLSTRKQSAKELKEALVQLFQSKVVTKLLMMQKRGKIATSTMSRALVQFFQSKVVPRLLMMQQEWKTATSTMFRAALAATSGLGLRLEGAAELLKPVADSQAKDYENCGPLCYSFDYEAVESLLWNGPVAEESAAATPLEYVSQRLREEDVQTMMQDVMLQKYEHEQQHQEQVAHQQPEQPVSRFGIRRRTPKERSGHLLASPSPVKLSNSTDNSVMLQRSTRNLKNRPSY